jgi:acetyltransferase
MALPPLNGPLARALVERSGISHLLLHLLSPLRKGAHDTPPDALVHLDALDAVLMSVSQLLADIPQLAELDINPLIVNFEGATAIHVSIRLSTNAPAGEQNFAIRPYPAELTETLQWQGRTLTLRPIRPEDEAQHRAFLTRLDPEDIRMRVFYSRRSIEHTELARLVQIDYEREMVFIAVAHDPDAPSGTEQTLGVVRAMADPDNRDAEFGIIIRSDLKGQGLGPLMMNKMIRYLRAHGTQRLIGTVIAENRGMRALAKRLGFVEGKAVEDDALRDIYLDLKSPLPT